jgi:hypothetical protein
LVSSGYNVPETEMWNMPIHILIEREKQYRKLHKNKEDKKPEKKPLI